MGGKSTLSYMFCHTFSHRDQRADFGKHRGATPFISDLYGVVFRANSGEAPVTLILIENSHVGA